MTTEEIMGQAQVFASSWALVGSRFDRGDEIKNATEQEDSLEQMVDALTAERDTALEQNTRLDAACAKLEVERDALMSAGKLALEALEVLEGFGLWEFSDDPDKPALEAIAALKAAGVK